MHTIKSIPCDDWKNTLLFVRNEEYDRYRKVIPLDISIQRLYNSHDLASTRQEILTSSHAEMPIMMADDDLKFFSRTHENKFIPMKGRKFREMVTEMEKRLLVENLGIVGLGARFMGNNAPRSIAYTVRPKCFFAINTRLMRQKKLRGYGRVKVQIDIEFGLQMLTAGCNTADLTEYVTEQAEGFQADGGVSTYRTGQVLRQAGETLKKLYPDFVTLVERKVKSGWAGVGDTRTEVRVAWKKAYKSNLKKGIIK